MQFNDIRVEYVFQELHGHNNLTSTKKEVKSILFKNFLMVDESIKCNWYTILRIKCNK